MKDIYEVNLIRHLLKLGIEFFSRNGPADIVGIDQGELEAAALQRIGDEVAGLIRIRRDTDHAYVPACDQGLFKPLSSLRMGIKCTSYF